jgi:GH43 family beta-xylosidase
MYYSVGTSDERHELRVATSVCPEGPYNEQERPLLDPASACFAIDPSPFRDVDGRWYLFYARDFLDSDGDTRPGTALVLAPLLEMLRVSDDFTLVMRARHDWQRYQAGRPMYGGIYDWHTLEGPCPVRRGRYYCLYSGGNWQNDSYGIDFVSADSVQGPWRDTNDGSGPRVLRTVPGRMIGPGHNSIVSGPGGRDLIAYHAWDVEMTARRLCLDGLVWTDDGPRSLGPNWTRQPMG